VGVPTVLFEQAGDVGHLVLNRPPRNEMSLDLFGELGEVIEDIGRRTIRGVVVRGVGRHFSRAPRWPSSGISLGR
jgi:enoyl-CoA hydratase/carnithine racemase